MRSAKDLDKKHREILQTTITSETISSILKKIQIVLSNYFLKLPKENVSYNYEEQILSLLNKNILSYLEKPHQNEEAKNYTIFIISQLDAVNRNCELDLGRSIFAQIIALCKEIAPLIHEIKKLLNCFEQNKDSELSEFSRILNNVMPERTILPSQEYRKERRLYAEQERLHKRSGNNQKHNLLHSQLNTIWQYAIEKCRPSKTVFISYAWPIGNLHQEWWTIAFIRNLAIHLNYAGIQVILDRIDSSCGTPLTGFMQNIKIVNNVFAISSRSADHKLKMAGPAGVKYELDLIKKEVNKNNRTNDEFIINIALNANYHHDDSLRDYLLVSAFHEGYLNCLTKLISSLYGFDTKHPSSEWKKILDNLHFHTNFSSVPAITPFFVPRSRLLNTIEETLSNRKNNLLICEGKSGSGKTDLILGFVWHCASKHYRNIYWLNGTSRETLIESYSQLAQNEELWFDPEHVDKNTIATFIKKYLESRENDLIIIDNALAYEKIHDLVPIHANQVIVTTHTSKNWPINAQKIDVSEFDVNEATVLINNVLDHTQITHDNIKQLIHTMGLLPKQIALACGYIQRHKITITTFLDLYNKHGNLLFIYELYPIKQLAQEIIQPPDSSKRDAELQHQENFKKLLITLAASKLPHTDKIIDYVEQVYGIFQKLKVCLLKPLAAQIIDTLLIKKLYLVGIINNREDKITRIKYIKYLLSHLEALDQHIEDQSLFKKILANGYKLLNILFLAAKLKELPYTFVNAPPDSESIVQPTVNNSDQEKQRYDEQAALNTMPKFELFLCEIWKYALGLTDENANISKKINLICECISDNVDYQVKTYITLLSNHLRSMGITVFQEQLTDLEDIDHIILISHKGISKSKQLAFNKRIEHNPKYQQCFQYPSNRFLMPILLNNVNYLTKKFQQLAELSFYKENYLTALKDLIRILYGFDVSNFDKYWQKKLIQYKIVNNCWNVPRILTKHLVEREYLLMRMRQMLSQQNELILTACQGMGGVGKTTLVLWFIEVCGYDFEDIYWFNSRDRQNLILEYTKLGLEKKWFYLEDNLSVEQQAQLVKKRLEELPSNCLIIFDGVPDRQSIANLFPVYEKNNCKILITSRNNQWEGNNIEVSIFTFTEAWQYVKNVLGDSIINESENVSNLIVTLGFLPLALALACAYIKQNNISIGEYLQLYNKQRDQILKEIAVGDDKNLTPIASIWNITKTTIDKKYPDVIHLLELCSFLHCDGIPIDLFKKLLVNPEAYDLLTEAITMLYASDLKRSHFLGAALTMYDRFKFFTNALFTKSHLLFGSSENLFSLLKEHDRFRFRMKSHPSQLNEVNSLSIVDDKAELKTVEAIRIAEEYSLLRKDDNKVVSLHAVFQQVIREQIPKSSKAQHLQRTALLLNYFCPRSTDSLSQHTSMKYILLPHYRSIYTLIHETEFKSEQPTVPFGILYTFYVLYGELEINIGNPYLAKKIAECRLQLQEDYHGKSSIFLVDSLLSLSNISHHLNEDPIPYLERAMKLVQPVNKDNQLKAAQCANALGLKYSSHKTVEAIALLEKSAEWLAQGTHHESLEWLHTYIENRKVLVVVYINKSNFQKVIELCSQALDIQKKYHQYGDDQTITFLISMSEACQRLGKIIEYRQYAQEALSLSKNIYGEKNNHVAQTLFFLGIIHLHHRDLDSALDNFNQAKNILANITRYPHDANLLKICEKMINMIGNNNEIIQFLEFIENKERQSQLNTSRKRQANENESLSLGSPDNLFFHSDKRIRAKTTDKQTEVKTPTVANDDTVKGSLKRSVANTDLQSTDSSESERDPKLKLYKKDQSEEHQNSKDRSLSPSCSMM